MDIPCIDCICLAICQNKTPSRLIEDCKPVIDFVVEDGDMKESKVAQVVDILFGDQDVREY